MPEPSAAAADSGTLVPHDRWWIAVFGAFTLLFAYVACVLAIAKPFWHDEIYTLLFADLPSLATMWRAAHDGIDLAPPVNAMLTHGLHAALGAGRLISRLPALVGYWTMSLVVFDLVRRRSHVIAALSAAALPCLTEAFRYATEARGYGLMLGLFAVALWSWSEAARGRRRALHLPLLALSLASGLWNQYFAVLAFVPIGVGEMLRSVRARRFDWGVAAAVGCAIAAAFPLRGLMHVAAGHASTYWHRAHVGDVGPAYSFLFAPLLTRPVLIALALAVLFGIAGRRVRRSGLVRCQYAELPAYEIGAGLATLAVPVAAVLLGVYGAGVFAPRYALPGVIGMSLVLPLAVARIGSRHFAADLVVATALVATFGGSAYHAMVAEHDRRDNPLDRRPLLVQQLLGGETIAVNGATEYLQLWYYAPIPLRPRIVYLADPSAALAAMGTDTVDRNLLALRRWSSVSVYSYEEFVASHRTFRIYAAGDGWLVDRLRASGARIDEVARDAAGPMAIVTLAAGFSDPEASLAHCAQQPWPSTRC